MKISFVTLIFMLKHKDVCRLHVWCANIKRLNADMFESEASINIIAHPGMRTSSYCAGVGHIPFDKDLLQRAYLFAIKHPTTSRMSDTLARHMHMFLKWQTMDLTQFDRVLFLDVDVDPYFRTHGSNAPDFKSARDTVRNMRADVIRATPDHESPINTGIFVLTPNATVYRAGVSVIKENRFNVSHGFELSGLPKGTFDDDLPFRVRRSRCIAQNTWSFVHGDSDQGFFSHMAYVRRAFRVVEPRTVMASHFWGWKKPFVHNALWCDGYAAHVRSLIPNSSCLRHIHIDTKSAMRKQCFFHHRSHVVR